MGWRREKAAAAFTLPDGRVVARFKGGDKPQPGSTATFQWNKAKHFLAGSPGVMLHFGFNGFSLTGGKVVLRKAEGQPADGDNDWLETEVAIPRHAYVLDFVLSDEAQGRWDNNDRKDFALLLGAGEFWGSRSHRLRFPFLRFRLHGRGLFS